MNDIKHEYTDEIVCPYCGYIITDSWDFDKDSGRLDCYECGKEFTYERDYDITYITEKIIK